MAHVDIMKNVDDGMKRSRPKKKEGEKKLR